MKPIIFCLIPVKDEEWIIERSLKSASIWADKIIVSDQGSSDRTVEIAKSFPKVTLIDNSSLKDFNEQAMRAPLFDEARKTPGKKLLISLDADEIFTPNFDSPEWETMLNAEEGTRFRFNLYNIRPGYHDFFTTIQLLCAFIDDGSSLNTQTIHCARQPEANCSKPVIELNDIAILHFQFTNWERMEKKQMWYQTFERIHFPQKSVIRLYRNYHWDKKFIPIHNMCIFPFRKEWIVTYSQQYHIDITSVTITTQNVYEEKIIEYINTYSLSYFSRIDIWRYDWKEIAQRHPDVNIKKFEYKQGPLDRCILMYLRRSHPKRLSYFVRTIDFILRQMF